MKWWQSAGLLCYRLLAGSGFLRTPFGRRCFTAIYLAYKRLFEAERPKDLEHFVCPGSTVFDVGANVGFYTVPFASWVGSDGLVHAIEPEILNVEELSSRLSKHDLSGRVQIHQAVAVENPGTRCLRINPMHPADHKVSATGTSVLAVSIDSISALSPERSVSLIKIDVQGAESLVLHGALETLRRWRPVVAIELDDANLREFNSSCDSVIRFMATLGYSPYEWRSGRSLTVDEVQQRCSGGKYFDCVFIHAEAEFMGSMPNQVRVRTSG